MELNRIANAFYLGYVFSLGRRFAMDQSLAQDKTMRERKQDSSKEQWITLKNGTHVRIDRENNITKGPKALKGQNLTELKAQEKESEFDARRGGNQMMTAKEGRQAKKEDPNFELKTPISANPRKLPLRRKNAGEGISDFDSYKKALKEGDMSYLASTPKGETIHLHKKKSGKYTDERQKLHDEIVDKLINPNSIPKKGEKPTLILTGGGSASGKSSAVDGIVLPDYKSQGTEFTMVDSDHIKSFLPEYKKIMGFAKTAAAQVHEESSNLSSELVNKAFELGANFLYDGTMKNAKKYEKIIKKAKDLGYKVVIVGVDIPVEEAIRRSDKRAERSGRKVPHEMIKASHSGFAKTFHHLQNMVDESYLYNNMVGQGEKPKLTYQKSKGVLDNDVWGGFVEKGKSNSGSKNQKTSKLSKVQQGKAFRERLNSLTKNVAK